MAQAGGGKGRLDLRRRVAALLDGAWREPGFCVPNAQVYPHQWLWDSCFHAVVWACLGSDRGLVEVANALECQADDGFVPHMVYRGAPDLHAEFWGRPRTSTITQPPMYGHGLAEQRRLGGVVPDELLERAARGLVHLGHRPRTPGGLIPIYHPWESGCDDSARWDAWFPDPVARRVVKGQLVAALQRGSEGHAVGSDRFSVGSIGFNALVAWNAQELAGVIDRGGRLDRWADELQALSRDLEAALAARWTGDRWLDDHLVRAPPAGTSEDVVVSGGVRTADSLLALLVDPRDEAFDQLVDPEGFGAPFGPRGVHRAEPTYEPDAYWRGSAWPQLTYLLMLAAERAGRTGTARLLAGWLVGGAERSGLAEHWNPESGEGLGARPQTWAGLALPAARHR